MPDTAVQLDNVNKYFGHDDLTIHVLKDINLTLPSGELALVMGPSGCGKTTLITIIAGLLKAEQGDITLFGQTLNKMSDAAKTEFRKHHIGFIFQQFNLLPTLTASENVAVPLLIQKMDRKKAMAKADAILEKVGLGDRLNFLPRDMSGGQQQRIAIARALVIDPRLIVCDEPTAALDHETGQTVMRLLADVATQADRCVLVVTHDNRIFNYGQRVVTMDDGRITTVTVNLDANADAGDNLLLAHPYLSTTTPPQSSVESR
jgi:putative ABC transport system ATP-binding protein